MTLIEQTAEKIEELSSGHKWHTFMTNELKSLLQEFAKEIIGKDEPETKYIDAFHETIEMFDEQKRNDLRKEQRQKAGI